MLVSLLVKFLQWIAICLSNSLKRFLPDRSSFNAQYQDLLITIMKDGVVLPDRTGTGRRSIPGYTLKADLRKEFPVLNLRKSPVYSAIAEMQSFMNGETDAGDFGKRGCNFWYANANKNQQWLDNPFRKDTDDCGPIYGAQWTNWQAHTLVLSDPDHADYDVDNFRAQLFKLNAEGWTHSGNVLHEEHKHVLYVKNINQVLDCVKLLLNNPESRRILFHAWNPADMNKMALPPCHMVYQFVALHDELHLITYQRSADVILGVNSNMVQAAYLLTVMAKLTGLDAATVTLNLADAHIYNNHIEAAEELISRPLRDNNTKLQVDVNQVWCLYSDEVLWMETRKAFNTPVLITGYEPDAPIAKSKLPMAV